MNGDQSLIFLQACPGWQLSILEMKVFLFILVRNFAFGEADEKIGKANVCVPDYA